MFTSVTGAIVHSVLWVGASFNDVTIPNPKFNPELAASLGFEGGISLYCVHGTADRTSSFERFANRINELNLPAIVSSIKLVSFKHRFMGEGIDFFAQELDEKIVANGDEHVILLGHSRGGLAVTLCATKAKYYTVHGIFNVCAPHKGSPWALWPLTEISTSVKQMVPGSDFLNELAAAASQLEEDSCYYYGAENDSIVPQQNACTDEHSHRLRVLAHHGHLSIMTSRKLVADIFYRLNKICGRLAYPQEEDSESEELVDIFEESCSEDLTPLEEVCVEIYTAIEELAKRNHFYSPLQKIEVLTKLVEMLTSISNGSQQDIYPQAETIGEFIAAYLQDETIMQGKKPREILGEFLTPSLPLFRKSKPESLGAIEGLVEKYQQVRIPDRQPSNSNDSVKISLRH